MTEQRPAAELRTTLSERAAWGDLASTRSQLIVQPRWMLDLLRDADLAATLSAANLRLEQRVEELEMELRTIATRRFDRTVFDDDTSFADWAQSRARAALAKVRP